MFGATEAIMVDLVKMALDAASLRHMTIANNIANANTTGYAPASVNFEQQMDVVRAAIGNGERLQSNMLSGIRPVIERGEPLAETDRTALLDTEMAKLAQNTVQYEALLKALGKHMSLIGSAIAEGKR
jgi:flagellar basal-body rod protein FlgB